MNSNLHIHGWILHAGLWHGVKAEAEETRRQFCHRVSYLLRPLGTADVPRLITKLTKQVEPCGGGRGVRSVVMTHIDVSAAVDIYG